MLNEQTVLDQEVENVNQDVPEIKQANEESSDQNDAEQNIEPDKKIQEQEEGHKHPSRLQKRINRLTREKYELKGRLDAIERMYSQGQGNHVAQDNKPSREQFETDADYIDALTDWKVDRALGNAKQEIKQEEELTRIQGIFAQREKAIRKEIPDYDDAIEDAADVRIPQAASDEILLSDVGPEIRYYLAKNPEIAEHLMSMRPIDVIREIGKIKTRIENEKEAKKAHKRQATSAPNPIAPVKGSSAIEKDPSNMTPDEWAHYRGYKK